MIALLDFAWILLLISLFSFLFIIFFLVEDRSPLEILHQKIEDRERLIRSSKWNFIWSKDLIPPRIKCHNLKDDNESQTKSPLKPT